MTQEKSSQRRHKSKHGIREFFFSEQIPYGLALTRIFLPLVLMVVVGTRWMYAREIYSTDGASAPIWITYNSNAFLPEIPGILAVGLFSVLFVSLLTTSLGLCTRLSLAISTVLYFYFNSMDMLSTMTKYSVIATHVLLLLTLSRCGDVWSLDSLFRRRKKDSSSDLPYTLIEKPKAEIWPQRLIQILVGVVYFGAAMTKINTPGFFSGEQMQHWMLTDANYHNPFGEQTAHFPVFLIMSAYITLVWEIAFLFLVWKGMSRIVMLCVGVVFHLLSMLLLGLYIFPLIYMVLYLAFLTEDDVQKLIVSLKRIKSKFGWKRKRVKAQFPTQATGFVPPVPSWILVGGILTVSGVTGITIEHFLDPYGMRREEGKYAIKTIDLPKANLMLTQSRPIEPGDKIFDLQTGTLMIGGVIANPRKKFYSGESIIAQCTLNPPHEDMYLQCVLLDMNQNPVFPVSFIVPRELNRCNYYFNVTDALESGEYALVIKYRGDELLRKTIIIETSRNRVVAN